MKFKDLHPNIRWRLLVNFLTITATMMVVPFLAVYFSGMVGMTVTGIMYVLVILSGMIGGLTGGYISDKVGRIKVMLIGETVAVVSYLIIAFINSPWVSLPYLTAGMFIINMLFIGAYQPASMALILDSSTSETREYIFRLSYWVNNLATAVGTMIGAIFFIDYHFVLFIVVTAVTLFSVFVTKVLLTEEYEPNNVLENETNAVKTKPWKKYGAVLKNRLFVLLLIGTILVLALEFQLTNYIGIRLANEIEQFSLLSIGEWIWQVDGVELLGILKTENTLLVFLMAFLVARWTKRFSGVLKLAIGSLAFTAGFFVMAYEQSPWILIFAMLVATVGEMIYIPVKQAALGDLAPDDSRSIYMAVNQVSIMAAEILGGAFIIVGTVFSSMQMAFLYLGMGIVGSICLVIMYQKLYGTNRHKAKRASIKA